MLLVGSNDIPICDLLTHTYGNDLFSKNPTWWKDLILENIPIQDLYHGAMIRQFIKLPLGKA